MPRIIVKISYLEGHHDCTRECIQIHESYNLSICGIRGLCVVGSGWGIWGGGGGHCLCKRVFVGIIGIL